MTFNLSPELAQKAKLDMGRGGTERAQGKEDLGGLFLLRVHIYSIPVNIDGQKIWRFYSTSGFSKYCRNFNLATNPQVTHARVER